MLTLDYKDDKFTLTGTTGTIHPSTREKWKYLEAVAETNFYRCPLCHKNSIDTSALSIDITPAVQERLEVKKLFIGTRNITCVSCRHYAIKIYHKLNTLYFSDAKWF
jgi:hypothetical protein